MNVMYIKISLSKQKIDLTKASATPTPTPTPNQTTKTQQSQAEKHTLSASPWNTTHVKHNADCRVECRRHKTTQHTHVTLPRVTTAQTAVIYVGRVHTHHPRPHWNIVVSIGLQRSTAFNHIPNSRGVDQWFHHTPSRGFSPVNIYISCQIFREDEDGTGCMPEVSEKEIITIGFIILSIVDVVAVHLRFLIAKFPPFGFVPCSSPEKETIPTKSCLWVMRLENVKGHEPDQDKVHYSSTTTSPDFMQPI